MASLLLLIKKHTVMKKILILLLLTLFSFVSIAQERELSDYEKYRMEKERERFVETDEEVFYIVEDMPKFKGNDATEFRKWIAQNVRYPEEAAKNGIQGKVIVSFVVNKNGEVVNAEIKKSVDPYLDAEAVRVVESSPNWIAGKQRGVPVNVAFTFPINFVLDTPVESETVVINNYNDYTQPNYRFLLTFGYTYPSYYDPFYYDWYYGYDPYYYGWYSRPYYNYGWYSYRYYHYYPRYYGHVYHYPYYTYKYPKYGRSYASNPYYKKTYRSGFVPAPSSRKTAVVNTRPKTTRQVTTTRATVQKRTYTPTYSSPRTSNRGEFNRSNTRTRVTSTYPRTQKSTTVRTESRTYNRPKSTYQRSSSSYQRSYSAPSKTYSAPSRAPSRSSGSYSRSSSATRSSGSVSRSSGSVSRSSGGSRSAGRR